MSLNLGGPTRENLVQDPLSVQHLDNQLYMSRKVQTLYEEIVDCNKKHENDQWRLLKFFKILSISPKFSYQSFYGEGYYTLFVGSFQLGTLNVELLYLPIVHRVL